ncbi:hypothetical protein MKY37_06290 [Psychrobacillus sp. FSL K6-2836]|uniref:hypothetical protein n=1 Tax=Psychrobacillus sp. FSL K6-2836 TaxID=2921548 RepID=UPI0030F9DB8E
MEGSVARKFLHRPPNLQKNIAAEVITVMDDQFLPIKPQLMETKGVSESATFDVQEAYFRRLKNLSDID